RSARTFPGGTRGCCGDPSHLRQFHRTRQGPPRVGHCEEGGRWPWRLIERVARRGRGPRLAAFRRTEAKASRVDLVPAYARYRLGEFLSVDDAAIIGTLQTRYAHDGF